MTYFLKGSFLVRSVTCLIPYFGIPLSVVSLHKEKAHSVERSLKASFPHKPCWRTAGQGSQGPPAVLCWRRDFRGWGDMPLKALVANNPL